LVHIVYEKNKNNATLIDQLDSWSNAFAFGSIFKRVEGYVPQTEGTNGTVAARL
jgi:hypothetical protein